MGDDEQDFNIATQERIDALGFKPQKEIGYNHLLPYADELDEESTRLFEEIKCNLGKAVLLREMKPGCGVWTSRLIKYIKIFGLKFSKADHIALIKLVYELVVIPDLEPTKLHKFATLLILLIKKKYLISPEELTLDWRPLYDAGRKMFTKGTTTLGMFHYTPRKINKHDDEDTQINTALATIQRLLKISDSHNLESILAASGIKDESLENTFEMLITFVKPYFPLSATSEILAELRPRLSPWSSESRQAMEELTLFLPVTLKPEQYQHGPGLWFEEVLRLWDVCQNAVYGEAEMMLLFASLAQNIPGHIDWDPYLPGMFTRFLRTFNLPVGFKQQQSSRQHSLDIYSMAVWIVWTIGPNSKTQEYLESFMKTIETYLQSANSGRWSIKLREFLRKLPQQFLLRVHRERHYKYQGSWENKVPEAHKLRDEDITRFVESMLEPVLAATCSRVGSSDACTALQHLATLRPALAAPPALTRLAATVDSLTEPHRHVAAMQAVVAVARPMLRGQDNGYPEGPTHVVPLLLAALPGLDPNDLKKTLVTLHFVSIFCTMVPLVDCSTASEHYPDLTEEEHIVCESTAMFEDFVLQYFDRIFGLIESSTMEQTRMELKDSESFRSKSESIAEGALASTTTIILMQSSPSIFCVALRKFHNFAIDRIFETKVAGQSVGYICRAFSRVNSKESFKVFLPQLCRNITELIGDSDAIIKEETLSNELLYNLQILSHLLEGKGTDLLPYIPTLVELWDKSLKFTAKEGYMFGCEALSHAMISMSSLYANDFRSSPSSYGSHVKDFLPIREWGRSVRMRDTKIDWHTPSAEEVACVQMLLDRYLPPELERINNFVSGQLQLTREQLHRSLYTISSILTCNYLLPVEDEEPVQFVDSLVPASAFLLTVGVTGEVNLAGRNVRTVVADTMHVLQDMLQEKHPDDTKNLCMLIQIWEQLSAAWSRGPRTGGLGSGSLEARARTLSVAKRALAGKGGGPGSDGLVRALLGDRALLQHETRVEIRASAGVGETGVRLLKALLELSVHPYSIVRIRAQHRLHWLVSRHAYSWHALVPRVRALLASPSHEQLKGALHVLLGPRHAPLVAKQDWAVARVLWPAVLRSTASEKTSVIKLLNSVVDAIQRHFPTIAIRLTITDACVTAGAALVPVAERAQLASLEATGSTRLEECSKKNEETYLELIDELVSAAESTELQWRYSSMAMTLLPCAVHLQTSYPPRAVRLAVRSLLHDSLPVRKAAVRLTLYTLKQRKRKHVKIEVDPYEVAGVDKPTKSVPGFRPDNAWIMWDDDTLPTTKELWDQPRYINTTAIGYYTWPEKLKVYAPYDQQPQMDRKRSDMNEAEGEIFDFFSDETNIDKLIGFLSMEDKKGRDKFNGYRYEMFKSLFRNYGDVFLSLFLPHLKRLICSSQESHQRCAAEIIAGLLCAPKHWSFEMNERLWADLEPLLEAAFVHMTAETVEDWGCCIATGADGADPRRAHRLPILLLRLAQAGASSAAAVCARLYALQGALAAQSWRVAPLSARALQCLREQYLEHPYQNVRERVGAFLVSIFDLDVEFPGNKQQTAPRVDDFMREITVRLRPLYDADGEVIILSQGTATTEPVMLPSDEVLEEKAAAAFAELTKADSHALGQVLKDIRSGVSIDTIKGACAEYGEEAAALAAGAAAAAAARSGGVERLRRRLSLALEVSGEGGAPAAPASDYDVAVNLLKTVLRWCVGSVVRGARGARPAHYALLRAACALSGRGADDELARLCDAYLAVLAHSLHAAPVFAVALDAVEEVLNSRSWWARAACVSFTQTLLFHSLPLVRGPAATRVRTFVLARMRDERVEVRDAAAKLLAGLMHCGVVGDEDEMLDDFRTLCRVRGGTARGSPAALARLHCGVLGLCAYVTARPYTLPPRLAEVCAELANHLNDPDPIPATIRKTLSEFKRTHQDEWTTHKAKLSEYELELLSELTSPPSYYA